jgi:type IV secretion system protein VirB5
MFTIKLRLVLLGSIAWLAAAPVAHAQWAVVDVGAIAQLVQQVETMREQLGTAREQLTQAREQYDAMTGSRGMESLLRNVERNYLPGNWADLAAALQGMQGAYGALGAEMQSALQANAVLSASQLAALSPAERADLEATRRSIAMLQALARQALATTSQRFGAIEQLIDAIPAATDQKAALDLQARIGAEATMLANEQAKLQVLHQAAQAESDAQQQRLLERAITDLGSMRRLPALGL